MCYDRISLGRLRFWIHMQDAVLSLQQLGEAAAPAVLGLGPCRPRLRRHCNPVLGVPFRNPKGHQCPVSLSLQSPRCSLRACFSRDIMSATPQFGAGDLSPRTTLGNVCEVK